ncbi:hypothetical protein ACFOSD_04310 [Salinispirillum marinum]|uniref:DUF4279 domain-containing protein n=2 Tax=Saccharospirillaceae TaxID=255527 RepID=A0ABV8BBF6_9GAMM
MNSDSVSELVNKTLKWAESLPSGTIEVSTRKEPEDLINNDYVIDYEIKISQKNPRSLGITIWFSEQTIGFWVGSYEQIAKLIGVKVSHNQSEWACAGTEPLADVDYDSLLAICTDLSHAELKVYAGAVFGYLKGVYVSINIKDDGGFKSSIGYSRGAIKPLSKLGIAKLISVPYEPW